MRAFLQDLRHTVRGLLRTPAFAILSVLTLALGIGANSAIFSVINGVVLQPLPYSAPERLVMITSQFPTIGFDRFWVSPPEFVELREHTRVFEDVGAYTVTAVNIGAGESPARVTAAGVSASLFNVFGTPPAMGRAFTDGEMRPDAEPVVVLSDELWREAYGADRSIVGQAVEVDGVQRTVVGVMPPGFDLRDERVRIWLPLPIDPEQLPNQRGSHFLYLVGRLGGNATMQQAEAELANLLGTWRELAGVTGHVPNDSTHRLQYAGLHEDVIGDARTSLWMLQGAVLFVLLVACANMANLLLARAESRQKEYAIRTALGAGRARLLGQFFGEGLVLAVAGGALGLLLGWSGVKLLLAANPDSIPRAAAIGLDWRVLLFTAGVVLTTSLIFALAPLLHLGVGTLNLSLKEGAARTTATVARMRLRRSLVVGEVALAVALVVGAGLMLRSFWNRVDVDTGFDRAGLTTYGVVLPAATYPDGDQRTEFFDELLRNLRETSGIQAVAAMSGLPPLRDVNANDTEYEGVPPGDPNRPGNVDFWQFVTPDYVATMGIPVVDGRGFAETDVAGAPPVVMVNETLARRYWPGQSAVGQRVRPGFGNTPWFAIVGVLKDVKQAGMDTDAGTELYFSYSQAKEHLGNAPRTMNVVVRSKLPPEQVLGASRRAVAALDPGLPLVEFRTMEAVISDSVARPRFLAQLLGVFALVALLLSAVGTYGVLSYMVTERRQEIGVRMALGADRAVVRRMVLGQGMLTAGIGIVIGLLAALALSRLVSSLLFGVSPADPMTFVSVSLVIAAVALLACAIPAWRATRVDPVVALRA